MDYTLAAIFYSLTTFILAIISFSYLLEAFTGKSKTMVAMCIHFLTDTFIFGIISFDLIRANYGLAKYPVVGVVPRSFFALVSASFVLYTIWINYFKLKLHSLRKK